MVLWAIVSLVSSFSEKTSSPMLITVARSRLSVRMTLMLPYVRTPSMDSEKELAVPTEHIKLKVKEYKIGFEFKSTLQKFQAT